MPSNKTTFAVGLFIIIGLGIAITAIVWLGMSDYFEKGRNYVTFFDESVQGLDKDSPVKYRGVSIGRVQRVGVAPDGTLIQVVLTIEEDMRIESDMYAQLKSVGITGIMFIEIDRKKEGEPDYHPLISFYTEYPIIVAKPSGVKMLMDGMDSVMDVLRKLDAAGISEKLKSMSDEAYQFFEDAKIEEVSSNLRSSIAKVDRMLDIEKWDRIMNAVEDTASSLKTLTANASHTVSRVDENVRTIAANMNKTVKNAHTTVARIERFVSHNEKEMSRVISSVNVSVKDADTLLKEGTRLVKSSDIRLAALERHLLATLQHLEKASENLNHLLERVGDQPSQLIFGEPLPPRKLAD